MTPQGDDPAGFSPQGAPASVPLVSHPTGSTPKSPRNAEIGSGILGSDPVLRLCDPVMPAFLVKVTEYKGFLFRIGSDLGLFFAPEVRFQVAFALSKRLESTVAEQPRLEVRIRVQSLAGGRAVKSWGNREPAREILH